MSENSYEVKNRPKNIKEFLKSSSFWKPALGMLVGGTAGYLYYAFVGCSTGSCAITGNPLSSIAFGSIWGFVITKRPCSTC